MKKIFESMLIPLPVPRNDQRANDQVQLCGARRSGSLGKGCYLRCVMAISSLDAALKSDSRRDRYCKRAR